MILQKEEVIMIQKNNTQRNNNYKRKKQWLTLKAIIVKALTLAKFLIITLLVNNMTSLMIQLLKRIRTNE